MIRATIYAYKDYDEFDKFNNVDDPPPVDNAVWEVYIEQQIIHPTRVTTFKHQARLDEDGKPFIYTWREDTTEPTYEKWCSVGFDHRKEENYINPGELAFYRNVEKGNWIISIETLEQLEEYLDKDWEIEKQWLDPFRDKFNPYHYQLIIR